MPPLDLLPLVLVLLLPLAAAETTTRHYRPLWPTTEPWPTRADVDAAAGRISKALQFETVSRRPGDDGDDDGGARTRFAPAMRDLHAHLARSYPAIFDNDDDAVTVDRLGCGDLSLLITVRGSAAERRPILLVSHLDVVAAPDAHRWTHPPFSGAVGNGSVWGRGAVDVKGPALAMLEALQSLLAEKAWRPRRSVLVALGHDEEVGGACGARRVAARLRETLGGGCGGGGGGGGGGGDRGGPLLHALWDEGPGVMLDGVPPLVARPTALVGTAEKRAVRVAVRARAAGGHASMPPIAPSSRGGGGRRQQKSDDVGLSVGAALGRVLAAVDARPPRAELRAPTTDMLLAAAPHADRPLLRALLPLAVRLVPLRPLVARALSRASAGGAALVRTTVVATRISAGGAGGAGENVMPQSGEAIFNVRLLPGWTRRSVEAFFKRRAREAGVPEAEVEVTGEAGGGEGAGDDDDDAAAAAAGAVAPSDGPAFAALRGAIERCWRFEESGAAAGGEDDDDGGEPRAPSADARPPLVAPTLLTGMTDSRHYARLVAAGQGGGQGQGGGGTLRFLPVGLSRASLARIHGTDERLDIGDLARAMCTYRVGIEALAAASPRAAAAAAAEEEDEAAAAGRQGGGGGGGGGGEL